MPPRSILPGKAGRRAMWRIRAWLQRDGGGVVTAAYVASCATHRAPAVRVCESEDDARRWVEREAQFLGAAVEWV
jgi:hypothetical protein